MKENTSWEKNAKRYQKTLEGGGTYQKDLILPNILRLLKIKPGETILDLACGPGFFTHALSAQGAKVIGVDISKTLIDMAKTGARPTEQYYVSRADKLPFIKSKTVDKSILVLAIQNIDDVASVFNECARVMKSGGRFFIVMNHPAFRIPKASSWGWDAEHKIQYRRVDSYLSESTERIQMAPGDAPNEYTISFHRPLQFYAKALNKAGFAVTKIEEWNSNRKSQIGPRAHAENLARKEIPLFIFLEAAQYDFERV